MSKKILLPLLVASLGFNIWVVIAYSQHSAVEHVSASITEAEKKYPLLSKDILQDLPQDVLINFYPLREELRKMTDPYGDDFGMYFEYLPTGTSIGINANDEFYAASLFKVPVIMAYYHGRERLGIKDDPEIEIKQEHIDREFGPLWEKGAGAKVKASEAVRLSLEESDNTAIKAMLPHIEQQDFRAVYDGIDLELNTGQQGAIVSARMYSSVLKALHFSSVINKDSSQEILHMLTRSSFSDKLDAGVPDGVAVAHKIGHFNVGEGKDEGYRDCGIVYEPRRPYILCMFSVGDENTARERMQVVSKKVYEYVSEREE